VTAGRSFRGLGPPSLLLALAIPALAWAAPLSPADRADLARGFAASALSSSEEPAVRAERALREPSAGFMLGTALGAWTAAREQLDFDLKNPQAAGAPHASQGPANLDAVDDDCREEGAAFDHLESRSRALSLEPSQVLGAAGADEPALRNAWRERRDHAPACTAG
jgi:hypothetical protein